jgi:hypothetical protein
MDGSSESVICAAHAWMQLRRLLGLATIKRDPVLLARYQERVAGAEIALTEAVNAYTDCHFPCSVHEENK